MKNAVVLFFALGILLKPLWPLAEYVIYYDYIRTNLCENRDRPQMNCNGSCYLSKQLAKESRQNEENPFEGPHTKTELFQIFYPASATSLPAFEGTATQKKAFARYRPLFIPTLFVFEVTEPPEGLL